MYSCVSGEQRAPPASAKVPTPPDASRRAPEGRRRVRDIKLETKQSSPAPLVMSNDSGGLPDLPGFQCSIPLSSDPSPCSSEAQPEVVAPLTQPAEPQTLVQVKLEEPEVTANLPEADFTVLGDPMDCISEPPDIFNLLGDSEDSKINFSNLGLDSSFDSGLHDLAQDPIEGLNAVEPNGMAVEMSMDVRMGEVDDGGQASGGCPSDQESGTPVALGIPYYVACQWEQAQQVQAQQQQAAVMLWWQAYLCGACGVGGTGAAAGMPFPGQQLGWTMPHQLPCQTNAVPDSFFPHLAAAAGMAPINTAGKATGASTYVPKRRRRQEGPGSSAVGSEAVNSTNNKKGRRPKQEERVCKNCGTRSTPFWRKNKQDGLPLCNACGLYLAKNDTPRPKVLWKSGEEEPASASCAEQHASHDMMDIEVMTTKIEPEVVVPTSATGVASAAAPGQAPATHC